MSPHSHELQFRYALLQPVMQSFKHLKQGEIEMPDYDKVAEWMLSQFKGRELYQEDAVWKMKKEFGDDYVYLNANGNYAIHRKVLAAFRKLTEGKVIWSRREKAWTMAREGEVFETRLED